MSSIAGMARVITSSNPSAYETPAPTPPVPVRDQQGLPPPFPAGSPREQYMWRDLERRSLHRNPFLSPSFLLSQSALDPIQRRTLGVLEDASKQMLAVREARIDGRYKRSFELLNLASLKSERWADKPESLSAFYRWQDPLWKSQTLSLR